MSLDIVPISLKEANAFVERYHRHHRPVAGHKFSIGATDGEHLMPVHYVACSHCGRAIGGAHTSAGTACVLWNSRMCS